MKKNVSYLQPCSCCRWLSARWPLPIRQWRNRSHWSSLLGSGGLALIVNKGNLEAVFLNLKTLFNKAFFRSAVHLAKNHHAGAVREQPEQL